MAPLHQCGYERCSVDSVGVCPVFEEINNKLDRIEDKLGDRLNSHSTRLRSLEGWRSFLVGAWAVVCIMGYVGWEYVKAKVMR